MVAATSTSRGSSTPACYPGSAVRTGAVGSTSASSTVCLASRTGTRCSSRCATMARAGTTSAATTTARYACTPAASGGLRDHRQSGRPLARRRPATGRHRYFGAVPGTVPAAVLRSGLRRRRAQPAARGGTGIPWWRFEAVHRRALTDRAFRRLLRSGRDWLERELFADLAQPDWPRLAEDAAVWHACWHDQVAMQPLAQRWWRSHAAL